MAESVRNRFGKLKGFTLVSEDKLNRAVYGAEGPEGRLSGGVGEDASAETILAAYDKLGGLIYKGKSKVKTGSFYDFENKKPRKKPEVTLVFRDLRGRKVELGENEAVPIEVQAAEKMKEEEAEESRTAAGKKAAKKKAAEKAKKGKGKKKGEEEGEEEELSGEDESEEEESEEAEEEEVE